ncbi:MAG: ATP-binding protein [Gammaproteobacteria bacterium]
MWRTIVNTLSKDKSTELEQAFVRLASCLILILYTSYSAINGLIDLSVVYMYVIAVPFIIAIIAWTYFKPGINHVRRIIGMLADLGTTTYAMAVSGDAASPLIVIYLWVTVGNGIRFGRDYLHLSMAMSLLGFATVCKFSPFWSQHHILDSGIILLMILLPLYVGFLLKRLQSAIQEAKAANRAKSQFLANMSHEIRTPLNGVIGISEMLGATQLNADQKDYVSTIQASAHTLLTLIEDILDISKIEAGKTTIEHSDFDLHLLVTTTVKMLQSQAEAKGLDFNLHISAETPYKLHGDALHLRQILINLIGNAIKFTHEGCIEINIEALAVHDTWTKIRFEINDTGIGIPKEVQDRIFETFTQANQSITREYGGSGLGTTISRHLIELMGGKLYLISEINKGSTFWFELDFDYRPAQVEISDIPTQLKHPKILLISTYGKKHEILVSHLKSWQLSWDHVKGAQAAQTLLQDAANKSDPFHIALIDKDGLDIPAQRFAIDIVHNPKLEKTNLVLISKESQEAVHPFLQSGYFCVLNSPIEKRLLFNTIHATSVGYAASDNITPFVDFQTEGNFLSLEILVGEDNPTNQKVIRKILEYAGHKVSIVDDGGKILDVVDTKSFDLIILDMHMPVMDGIEATKIYRFTHSEPERCPIIMLTADATTDASQACKDAGVDAFLTKPVKSKRLITLIASLINEKKSYAKKTRGQGVQGTPGSLQTASLINDKTPVIDIKILENLTNLTKDMDFMRDLIHGFIDDSAKTIGQIEQALERQQYLSIQDSAHALKGSAKSIGATAMADYASAIHTHTSIEDRELLSSHFYRLKDGFKETQSALLTYLDKLDSAVI